VLRSTHLTFLHEEMRDAQGREGVCPVNRTYDIFEIFPDAVPVWRRCVSGHENAIRKLQEFAIRTSNELRVMHVPTAP
jgi:hypothetical protein